MHRRRFTIPARCLWVLCLWYGAMLSHSAEMVKATPLPSPPPHKGGFTELPDSATGLRLGQTLKQPVAPKPLFVANPGLAAGDFDGDGQCDLFICSFDGASALFRNLGGWRFTNVTSAAGLDLAGRVLYGATFADVNGDRHLDLIVVSLTETNSLFLNDGKGRFAESAEFPWRKSKQGGEITPALADIDGDGDLDLYVTSYSQRRYKDVIEPAVYEQMVSEQKARLRRGEPPDEKFAELFEIVPFSRDNELDFHLEERALPHLLYLNQGGGRFTLVDESAGLFRDESGKPLPMSRDWGLGVTFRDVNGDSAPDLYVCNDFLTADRFWINDGKGRFQLSPKLALRHTSRFSMGVDLADINRDGHLDILTLDMLSRDHARRTVQAGTVSPTPIVFGQIDNRPQHMQNALFLGRPDGTYAEIAQFAGVKATEWSWAAVFMDADLDGYEDLFVTTGMERDFMDVDVANRIRQMGQMSEEQHAKAQLMYPRLNTPNLAFRNRGNLTFEDVGNEWGFRRAAVSGGMVTADFDNDGDLDTAINNQDGPPEIYRNEVSAGRLAVRLHGRAPNTQAVGAKITLIGGAAFEQGTEVICGGTYASGRDTLRVFACAKDANAMRLEIRWRDGKTSVVRNVRANHLYEITEPDAVPKPVAN